jgi:hypothetical protein
MILPAMRNRIVFSTLFLLWTTSFVVSFGLLGPKPSAAAAAAAAKRSPQDEWSKIRNAPRELLRIGAGMALTFQIASSAAVLLLPAPAIAANTIEGYTTTIENASYSVVLPSNWKVTSQKKDINLDQNGLLLSVIDLQGGATVTVVREQSCPVKEFFDQPKLCDLPFPNKDAGGLTFASEESTESIVKKLIIRRDDRDNAALGADPTTLDSVSRMDDGHAQLVASTRIPTGAVKKDAIGRTVQENLVRVAKTNVGVQTTESNELPSLVSVWISAPQDEWQTPASGIRLQQVVESVVVK